MKLNNEAQDKLAAEYVLGTLQGPARVRFERMMQADAGLAQRVEKWELDLGRMLDVVPEAAPPQQVWNSIEDRLFPQQSGTESLSFLQSLGFWRLLGTVTTTIAITLAVVLTQIGPQHGAPQHIMVVANEQGGAGWVLTSGKEGLLVKALNPTAMPKGKVCEVWLELPGQMPRSVGILPDSGKRLLPLPVNGSSSIPQATVKVSIEDEGGSKAGRPSSEIIFSDRMIRL